MIQDPDDNGLVVAVLTFRRPADLTALLPLLLAQLDEVAAHGGNHGRSRVLVVDNDPEASARVVVEGVGDSRVDYAVEPEPGIAAARNRALIESAREQRLVFIDDDERPSPGWLRAMMATQASTGAVAVAGPVISDFDGEIDPWLVAGGFFKRRRLPTGSVLDVAATNNLLLDLTAVRRLGLRFDGRYGLSGGEDTLFTRSLAQHGCLMVWCDEAVVTDRVPTARMTRRWVLQRAFSSGNSASSTVIELIEPLGRRLGARVGATGRGLLRVAGGGGRYLAGLVLRSPTHQARGLRTFFRGAGMVTGAWGYVFGEYQRRPARTNR